MTVDARLTRRRVLGLLSLVLGTAVTACGDDAGRGSEADAGLGDTGPGPAPDTAFEPDLPPLPDVDPDTFPPLDDDELLTLLEETRDAAMAYFEASEIDDVAELGALWLAEVAPAETEAEVVEALEPVFRRILAQDGETPDETAARLRGFVRLDFVQGNVVDLEGWTLSPTELALASIVRLVV